MIASLLSPNFKGQPPTAEDVKFASIIWGLTLGIGVLTAWKAVEQMIPMWRRNRCTRSLYIWMVWGLWIDNMIQGAVCWTFMDGILKPSFLTFFSMIVLWTLQTQLSLQIIINRAALIMLSTRKVNQLKWGVALVVLLINISVFCIWIPARLQISPRFIAINQVWDRIEKVLFLLIDAGLNAYFLYLVKARLISQGLDKYKPLFNFNSGIVAVSIAMDVLLISMMDLRNSFSYIAFHPLAYMVKLYIELVMTDLMVKVVRSSRQSQSPEYNSQPSRIGPTKFELTQQDGHAKEDYSNLTTQRSYTAHISAKGDNIGFANIMRNSLDLGSLPVSDGIKKTVSMMVNSKTEQISETSSLEELNVSASRCDDGGAKSNEV